MKTEGVLSVTFPPKVKTSERPDGNGSGEIRLSGYDKCAIALACVLGLLGYLALCIVLLTLGAR